MGGFFKRRDRDGQERWWLAMTGKGNKERLLPATAELMAERGRYRQHYESAGAALPARADAAAAAGRRTALTDDARWRATDCEACL